MTHYRVYFLDDCNKIIDITNTKCKLDEHAIAMAREKAAGRKFDIWQEDRWLGLFDPTGRAIKG